MDRETAREILSALTSDLDAPDDLQVMEALRLAREDPELGAWWERQRREDATIGGLLREIAVPGGLLERLSSLAPKGSLNGPAVARSRLGLVLGWFAAAALLVGAGLTALHYAYKDKSSEGSSEVAGDAEALRAFRVSMVEKMRSLDGFDFRSKNLHKIRAWLIAHEAPVGANAPEVLDALEGMGCRILDWRGRQVSLLCFRNRKGETWHLFTISREVFDRLPEAELDRILVVDERETKAWPDGDVFHLLVAGVDVRGGQQ